MTPSTKLLSLVATAGFLTACNDGEVRFGPPGGLRIRGNVTVSEACPLPMGVSETPSAAECATVTWGGPQGIFAKYMDAGLVRGNCAAGGCHNGPNDPTGVNMVAGDASLSYDALALFTNGGRPYVSTDAATEPYLMCNIDPGTSAPYGAPMPKGPIYEPMELQEIGLWAACGMSKDGDLGGGVGGGGGALGGGGAGGIGGAGM